VAVCGADAIGPRSGSSGALSGGAFLSIREDEIAAEAMGIHTTRYKIWAFVISAFFAGWPGASSPHRRLQLHAEKLGFQKSFDIIINGSASAGWGRFRRGRRGDRSDDPARGVRECGAK